MNLKLSGIGLIRNSTDPVSLPPDSLVIALYPFPPQGSNCWAWLYLLITNASVPPLRSSSLSSHNLPRVTRSSAQPSTPSSSFFSPSRPSCGQPPISNLRPTVPSLPIVRTPFILKIIIPYFINKKLNLSIPIVLNISAALVVRTSSISTVRSSSTMLLIFSRVVVF